MTGKGKSKLLKVYQTKESGSIMLNPTKFRNGKFVMKNPPKDFGNAMSGRTSNEELGKAVRKALEQCD